MATVCHGWVMFITVWHVFWDIFDKYHQGDSMRGNTSGAKLHTLWPLL